MRQNTIQATFLRVAILSAALSLSATAAPSELFTINDGDARVRQWNPLTGAFIGDPALLTDAGLPFNSNSDIEWDGQYFYSIASGDARVRRFNSTGQFIDDVAFLTDTFGPVTLQVGLAFDGIHFYTIAPNDARIRQYTLAGQFIGDFANLSDSLGPVTTAAGIAKDSEYFYTIASGASVVRRFDLTGHYLGDLTNLTDGGAPFTNNTGIAVGPIPEPTTAALLLFATVFCLRRRALRNYDRNA